MIEFFDTTVLVAAMVEDEPRHEACAQALEGARDGYASTHSLAECYATLTSALPA
ncbi:MAG: PIN domain-containing protein [Verrucomicrobia bacterium]|nr:PIN domain-containing protein [Verrucomicrobiota bacterium]